jgi:hypothetical protein
MLYKPFHFYASSVGEWRVSEDIESLIKGMKQSGLSFVLWKVPGPVQGTSYKIKSFIPVVDDLVYLGSYLFDGASWESRTLDQEHD